MIIKLMSQYEMKEGAFVKTGSGLYGIILSVDEIGAMSTTYNVMIFNISNYWPIRNIQLFILKKMLK